MYKRILILVFASFQLLLSHAQNNPYQPTFMVIPYAKSTESLIDVYEDDGTYQRMLTAMVQEGLLEAGALTVDFSATYKDLEASGLFRGEVQGDLKTILLDNSPADIYVEIEISQEVGTQLVLKAYDAFTQQLLSSKSCATTSRIATRGARQALAEALSNPGEENTSTMGNSRGGRPPAGGGTQWSDSGQRQSNDKVVLKDFLALCNEKFGDISKYGRAVNLEFRLSEDCEYDFYALVVDGDYEEELSVIIEDWLLDPANVRQYGNPNVTDKAFIVKNVKIPTAKEQRGTMRRYTPSRFGSDIRRYLSKLSLTDEPGETVSVEVSNRGGQIVITLK